jgi:hypothetical protein
MDAGSAAGAIEPAQEDAPSKEELNQSHKWISDRNSAQQFSMHHNYKTNSSIARG